MEGMTMPEDEITQREVAALTRRYENNLQIVRGDIAALDNRLMALEASVTEGFAETREQFARIDARFDALSEDMRTNQARLVELLSQLIGRDPNTT
jgi:hypothetical protein